MSARRLHRTYRVRDERHEVDVTLDGERVVGTVDGSHVEAEIRAGEGGEIVVRTGGRDVRAVVARRGGTLLVAIGGRTHEISVAEPGAGRAAPSADPFVVSPMAGLLVKVAATPGGAVAKGGVLFVVEAMKMEYVVAADRDVIVAEVKRRPGERVDLGEVVATFREPVA